MNESTEREAFEAWCLTQGWEPVHMHRGIVSGEYAWSGLNAYWDVWQARASQSVPSPVEDRDGVRYRWLREKVNAYYGGLTVAQTGAFGLEAWSGDDLDGAIDWALAQEGAP